ncbi:MAG: Uma2 family endonuclease [Aggregatilineales bacterium]
MVTQQRLYTVAKFEAIEALTENSERRLELVNGVISEKRGYTQLNGAIVSTICEHIYSFLKQHALGRSYISASYHSPGDGRNVRQPRLSYVNDLSREVVEKGSASYMPDLAIEVKSPDDTYDQMREKADYYLKNGSKLVWLFYPEKRLVETRSAKTGTDILTIDDTLDGGDILPDFKLLIKTVFADMAG